MSNSEELPFIPLAEPIFDNDCVDMVAEQVRSTFVGPGKTCAQFSEALADYVGMPHAVLTVSGTVALSLAAWAAGLRPGDEIVVPSYGVISTINAFASIGLKPVLAKIDRNSACVTAQSVAEAVTPDTKAVCYVNFSGTTGADLEEIAEFCRDRGLLLIEDAACALGQQYKGKQAGSFGDVSISSFSVPKVITTGQGGVTFLRNEEIRDKAIALTDQGDIAWRRTNLHRGIGTNIRFNDIQAALGVAQLRTLPERLARKRSNHAKLKSALAGKLFSVPGEEAPLHNIVFSPEADDLVQYLRERKIGAARQYRAIYHHPPFEKLETNDENAEFWYKSAVYLPFGLALTEDDCIRMLEELEASGKELLTLF